MLRNKHIDLQLFAEGDPVTPIIEIPAGKTFSEDYVKTVREEAKENRIARKAAEQEVIAIKAKFKSLIGLKDTDDLNDDALTKYQTRHQEEVANALKKANERLVLAEIKSLEGYDYKLVDRLLNKATITVTDTGEIKGLKEAVTELEKEFPQIKKAASAAGGANPPTSGTKTAQTDYEDAVKASQQHPGDSSLMQKVFLLKEKLKK